jgi:hypothetical protein
MKLLAVLTILILLLEGASAGVKIITDEAAWQTEKLEVPSPSVPDQLILFVSSNYSRDGIQFAFSYPSEYMAITTPGKILVQTSSSQVAAVISTDPIKLNMTEQAMYDLFDAGAKYAQVTLQDVVRPKKYNQNILGLASDGSCYHGMVFVDRNGDGVSDFIINILSYLDEGSTLRMLESISTPRTYPSPSEL